MSGENYTVRCQPTYLRRLKWWPVLHTCDHFEARLMASPTPFPATNQCSACAQDGRAVQPHFDTPSAVAVYCTDRNIQEGRA